MNAPEPILTKNLLSTFERRVSLGELLDVLVLDGMVAMADADKLRADRRLQKATEHPLTMIADQKWKSLLPPHKLLTLDALAEWFAAKCGLEYFHIDPLKIDFTRVGEAMSVNYAQRFFMLPIEMTSKELVVATCEPFLTGWEKELALILRVASQPSRTGRLMSMRISAGASDSAIATACAPSNAITTT